MPYQYHFVCHKSKICHILVWDWIRASGANRPATNSLISDTTANVCWQSEQWHDCQRVLTAWAVTRLRTCADTVWAVTRLPMCADSLRSDTTASVCRQSEQWHDCQRVLTVWAVTRLPTCADRSVTAAVSHKRSCSSLTQCLDLAEKHESQHCPKLPDFPLHCSF
jgi:hypothetical protein